MAEVKSATETHRVRDTSVTLFGKLNIEHSNAIYLCLSSESIEISQQYVVCFHASQTYGWSCMVQYAYETYPAVGGLL